MTDKDLRLADLGKYSGLTMVRQGVAMIIAFASSILLARVLGPELKGIFGIALLVPTTTITLVNLGIGPSSVFHIARGVYTPSQALRQNVKLALLLGAGSILLAALVISIGAKHLFPNIAPKVLWLSLVYIPFGLLAAFSLAVLQGKQDFQGFNYVALGTQLCGFLLSVILVWLLQLGVAGAILSFSGGQLAGFIGARIALGKPEDTRAKDNLLDYARTLLPYGLHSNVNTAADFSLRHIDQFLVNLFLAPSQAGIYILATGLAERLAIMSSSPSALMLPRISGLADSEAVRQQLTPIVTRHVLASAAVAGVVASTLASVLIESIYGPAFAAASTVFRIMLPGTILLSFTRVLASDIAGRGQPRVNAYISLLGLALTLALDSMLIPRQGIVGAAFTYSVVSAIAALLTLCYYSRHTGVPWSDVAILKRSDVERLVRVARTQWSKRMQHQPVE